MLKHFSYLESQYGYANKESEYIPYMYYVKYLKNDLMVRIGLACRHNFIEIFIFNKVNLYAPTSQDQKHSISLQQLIHLKNKELFSDDSQYENLMPSRISFDESIKIFSDLLKDYAEDILKGVKWISQDTL